MKHVEHKGYQGSVSYEDELLVVQILHITDFVVVECNSASEVGTVFIELVDEYITDCKTLGREPNKPFKGTFNVRISPDHHREAVLSATRREQSLNTWVSDAIREKLADERSNADKQTMDVFSEKLQMLALIPEQYSTQRFQFFEMGKTTLPSKIKIPPTVDDMNEMTKKLTDAATLKPGKHTIQ